LSNIIQSRIIALFGTKSARIFLTISLLTFSLGHLSASGQNLTSSTADVKPSANTGRSNSTDRSTPAESTPVTTDVSKKNTSDSKTEINDRVRALEDKLEEMQRTIATQQQTIKALADKLAGSESVMSTAVASTSVAEVKPAEDTNADAQQAQPKTVSIDDRVKKLEGDALRIGPLRVSGDFRLRADGIFRSADPNPPAGFTELTHQQNVRMRYRFRLNLDTELSSKLSFHGQLATGPINNPLTNDQDFGETVTRHPFFVNEAWIDYHPTKAIQLQAGRVQEIFADNLRFLFDDDVRFNGFNEKYTWHLKKPFADITSIEARAGQYIFSNPNVAIVTAGSPLAQAGAVVGSTGRASNLFHQGLVFNQKYNEKWSGQFGGDVQLYRNQNQIQLASTANGVPLIVQNGLGITLSGPVAGTGNATTTNGGAIYTARSFQIARLMYKLSWAGFQHGDHVFPVVFNVQGARNVGVGINERDSMLAFVQVGDITKRGDTAYTYLFTIKGANSLISQLTDDDIGTNSGVNIRAHLFRFELGLSKKVTWQSLLFIQNELRNSGQFPSFFVPLNGFSPRQYRVFQQLVFKF